MESWNKWNMTSATARHGCLCVLVRACAGAGVCLADAWLVLAGDAGMLGCWDAGMLGCWLVFGAGTPAGPGTCSHAVSMCPNATAHAYPRPGEVHVWSGLAGALPTAHCPLPTATVASISISIS